MRRLFGLALVVVGFVAGRAALKGVPEHCGPRVHGGGLYVEACTRAGSSHDVPWWLATFMVVAGLVLLLGKGVKR